MNVLSHESSQLIARTLGEAIVRMWSRLPQDVQHDLFEETMNSLDGTMRSKLAIFCTESIHEQAAHLQPDRWSSRIASAARPTVRREAWRPCRAETLAHHEQPTRAGDKPGAV